MIENIRKYNILIIIGLVVVGAALVIGLNTSNMRGPGGQPYIKIGSRTYSDVEYRQLGIHGREIVTSLAQSGDFQRMYQVLFSLSPSGVFSPDPDQGTEAFFINRMLIQQGKKEFGIHPSDEEISEFTRSLISFQENGEFDPESYALYLERGLGRMGMTEKDFRALVSDIIATSQIRSIISSGLLADRESTAGSMALDNQQISGSVARLELSPFKDKLNPTDEELKSYWELIQNAFTTPEERRFTYVLAAPEVDPADFSKTEEEDKPETIADAAMSDEAKAKAARKKAREKAAKEAELAEKKRQRERELNAKFDDFIYRFEEQSGKEMAELAAEYGWEPKTTEFFAADSPPIFLDLDLRNASQGGKAVSELFRITPTSDPLSLISQPLAVGENMWLVARLDEIKKSRPKTFEEAKEEVKVQYIREKAAEEMEKVMKEAAAKIAKALEEGSDFIDAAVNAGLKEMEPFSGIKSSFQPEAGKHPTSLFQLARTIDPNGLSEPLIEADRAYLVYVSKREVLKDENREQALDREVDIAINTFRMAAFSDWLKSRQEAALIERYYRP